MTITQKTQHIKQSKKQRIVLIGMAGSGKSTVGRLLAKKLGWRFIDGDECIRRKTKTSSLGDLIATIRERKFLKIEETTMSEYAGLKHAVFAPGGSIVYSKKVMSAFKKNSVIIWLRAPAVDIKKRITAEKMSEIIFLKSNSLHRLLHERNKLYEMHADMVATCARAAPFQIAQSIKDQLFKFY